MSDSQQIAWSDNPYAPNVTQSEYFGEKVNFAGGFVCWILYGIVIMVFLQCMAGLFDPVHRRGEPVKWGLVSYTVVMFSIITVITVMNFVIQSISYVDNRKFPGVEDLVPAGPYGYLCSVLPFTLNPVPDSMSVVNGWLADGLLLYRCYVIYSMSLWVIAFPCLMYLGSVATGISLILRSRIVYGSYWPAISYLSVSVSLNVLLTLMIVFRLVMHARNTRTALGMTGIGGLSKAIITMLVESCALYSAISLSVLGPFITDPGGYTIAGFFVPVLPAAQVIASLLIIQRVANRSALTSKTIASGHLSTFKARSRGRTTGAGGPLPGGDLASWVDRRGACSSELGVETTIE